MELVRLVGYVGWGEGICLVYFGSNDDLLTGTELCVENYIFD